MRICEIAKGRPIVYVDMDGVLADLFNYSAELNNVEHYNQMSDAEFEQFFRDTDAYDLFRSIPMFPTANKLLRMVKNIAGGYVILSSPLSYDQEGSIQGKREWLHKNIDVLSDGVIFEKDKAKYAVRADGTPNILIDDWGTNVRKWADSGGKGNQVCRVFTLFHRRGYAQKEEGDREDARQHLQSVAVSALGLCLFKERRGTIPHLKVWIVGCVHICLAVWQLAIWRNLFAGRCVLPILIRPSNPSFPCDQVGTVFYLCREVQVVCLSNGQTVFSVSRRRGVRQGIVSKQDYRCNGDC